MDIILDTNFMLAPVQLRIDVYGELRRFDGEKNHILVPEPCISELKKLSNRSKSAKAALELLRMQTFDVIKMAGEADQAILKFVGEHPETAVATNDRALIKSLKAHGVKVIRIRQRRLLAFA